MYTPGWLTSLIRRYRPDANLTALSRHLGHARVDKLSKTNRQGRHIQDVEMQPTADFLGISLETLIEAISEKGATNAPKDIRADKIDKLSHKLSQSKGMSAKVRSLVAGEQNLPTYGSGVGGRGGMIIDKEIQWINRPLRLDGVDGAYALRIPNDSMRPMYWAGDYVYVHPLLPLVEGRPAVVVTPENEGIVGLYRSRESRGVVLEMLYPAARETLIPHEDVATVHKIVGSQEP